MILGSFSGSNSGDVAVLYRIIAELDFRFPQSTFFVPTTVPSFIGNSKLLQEYDTRPVSMRRRHLAHGYFSFQTLRAVRKCDAIITTANMFFDRNLFNPWNNFIFSLLPILILYKALRRKGRVIAAAVSITPPSSAIGGMILRRVLELHDFVAVRDDNSATLATALSKHIKFRGCYPDVVIGQQPSGSICEVSRTEATLPRRVGINLSSYFSGELIRPDETTRSGWITFFARLITVLSETHSCETSMIVTSGTDEGLASEISELLDLPIKVWGPSELSHVELQSMITELDVYLSMRMHGAIFAFSSGVPCIGLCFTKKLRHFYTDYDLTPYRMDLLPNSFATDDTFEKIIQKTIACAQLSLPKKKELQSKMADCVPMQKEMFDGIASCIQDPLKSNFS